MTDQLDMFGETKPEVKRFVLHPESWDEVEIKSTPEGEMYRDALRKQWEAER